MRLTFSRGVALLVFVTASCNGFAFPSQQSVSGNEAVSKGTSPRPAPLRFDELASQLASQQSVTILCEGVPSRYSLTDADAKNLQQRFNKAVSSAESVQIFAQSFDYDCEAMPTGIYLLRKRYTDSDDLPDVSAEEITRAFIGMRALWMPFAPPETLGDSSKSLLSGLNTDLLAKLENGFVPTSELPTSLRDSLYSLGWSSIADTPMSSIRNLAFRLEQCQKKGKVTVSRKDLFDAGVSLPVYSGNIYRYRGTLWNVDVPISSVGYVQPVGATTIVRANIVGSTREEQKASVAHALRSDAAAKPAVSQDTPTKNVSITLSEFVERCNKKGNAKTIFRSDTALAQKRIHIFGEERVAPTRLMESVAGLYGLRVTNSEGVSTLTTNAVRMQKDPSRLGNETLRLVPLPVRRYIWQGKDETVWDSDKLPDLSGRASRLYDRGMRRLHSLAETAISSTPGGKVPLESLPKEATDLIALTSLATFCEPVILHGLYQPIPAPLLHFNDSSVRLHVNMSTTPGNSTIVYTIRYEDAQWESNTYF